MIECHRQSFEVLLQFSKKLVIRSIIIFYSLRTDAIAGTSGGVLAKLPDRENLKKSIRRTRRKNLPPNPKTLAELGDIPELYRRTATGDNFFLFDSKDEINDGRVLVFATRRNLAVLGECYTWSADGTFKVST